MYVVTCLFSEILMPWISFWIEKQMDRYGLYYNGFSTY